MKFQNPDGDGGKRGAWIIGLVAIAVLLAGALSYVGVAGSEALFSNLLAATLAVSVVGGSIFLSLWAYRRNREAHNAMARRHDLALREIAGLLNWQFRPGYGYDLTTGGHFEGWGSLDGTLYGFPIRVGVECDSAGEGPSTFSTVVIVKPPSEGCFSIGTNRELKFARKKGRLVCRDAPELSLEELEPLVVRAVISRARLTVTLAPPARYFKGMSYELATQTDISTLREAIAACALVGKRLRATSEADF